MMSRLPLYLASARSVVGKRVGIIDPYSSAQLAVAEELWAATKSVAGYDDVTSGSVLGNTEGETSFVLNAWGDHHEAIDMVQHHRARRDLIRLHTGIDMETASPTDQFRGVYAEMTEPWSAYRHVDAHLRAAVTTQDKITVLVHELEQSASQQRDIARRTPMAQYWTARLGADAPIA